MKEEEKTKRGDNGQRERESQLKNKLMRQRKEDEEWEKEDGQRM